VIYSGLVDFWRSHIFFFFSYYFCFCVGIYTEVKSLEVLMTYSLSVEIVSVFRQDSVVARLKCYLSPLDWGVWPSRQAFATVLRAPGLSPSTAWRLLYKRPLSSFRAAFHLCLRHWDLSFYLNLSAGPHHNPPLLPHAWFPHSLPEQWVLLVFRPLDYLSLKQ
jgi:hypothetical protein